MSFLNATDSDSIFDPVCQSVPFNWWTEAISMESYCWDVLTVYYRCLLSLLMTLWFSFPDVFGLLFFHRVLCFHFLWAVSCIGSLVSVKNIPVMRCWGVGVLRTGGGGVMRSLPPGTQYSSKTLLIKWAVEGVILSYKVVPAGSLVSLCYPAPFQDCRVTTTKKPPITGRHFSLDFPPFRTVPSSLPTLKAFCKTCFRKLSDFLSACTLFIRDGMWTLAYHTFNVTFCHCCILPSCCVQEFSRLVSNCERQTRKLFQYDLFC